MMATKFILITIFIFLFFVDGISQVSNIAVTFYCDSIKVNPRQKKRVLISSGDSVLFFELSRDAKIPINASFVKEDKFDVIFSFGKYVFKFKEMVNYIDRYNFEVYVFTDKKRKRNESLKYKYRYRLSLVPKQTEEIVNEAYANGTTLNSWNTKDFYIY